MEHVLPDSVWVDKCVSCLLFLLCPICLIDVVFMPLSSVCSLTYLNTCHVCFGLLYCFFYQWNLLLIKKKKMHPINILISYNFFCQTFKPNYSKILNNSSLMNLTGAKYPLFRFQNSHVQLLKKLQSHEPCSLKKCRRLC